MINGRRFLAKNTYIFAFVLLIVVILINRGVQDNLLEMGTINRNLRVFLPLIILAVGQAIVILGGGLDLSVGTMVSMCNAILATQITPESTPGQIGLALVLALGAGMLAGALNGVCVAYLRLQPIVTTYATSFVFSGIALLILPRPGGAIPRDLTRFYRSMLGELPLAFYVMGLLLLVWFLLRHTRFGQFLYAAGDNAAAAYTTGVPVNRVKLLTYVLCGLFAALAGLALTLSSGSGSPTSGDAMTLDSIVAVVLGGTRAGQGGIVGAMIGVIILGIIRNIISFANIDTWSQTLVDALIIITALASPGAVGFINQQIREFRIRLGHVYE